MNAIVGDNGIIIQAQSAKTQNAMAVLEEFLQQKYVECYEGNFLNNVEMLKYYGFNYFYEPLNETGLTYILDSGHMYYLIDKSKLPEDISSQLDAGNAGEGTYNDYSTFKDVYGVTTDLKVYYCADGLSTMIGAEDEHLEDSGNRVAISSGSSSGLSNFLKNNYDWIKTDENGNVLTEGLSSMNSLSIENTNMNSLTELYNFSTLTTLTLKNTTLNNLSGIEYCSKITSVYIYDSKIGDYSALGKLANLQKLYLENVNQSEVTALGIGLASSNLSTLKYFGVYNSMNVTDLNQLNNISNITKSSIRYLYLYMCGAENLELNEFSSVYEIRINGEAQTNPNLLKSFSGTFENLQYIYGMYATSLETINVNASKLYYLDVRKAINLEDFTCFSNCTNLRYLYLYQTGVRTLNFLENDTNLYYLYCYACPNLGNGYDTTYDKSTKKYTKLGKLNQNSLYSLRNKTNMYYVQLENCPYLAYVSYLQGCTGITALRLYNTSFNISTEEMETLSNIIKQCSSNVSFPSGTSISIADSSTQRLYLVSESIKKSDFETLKNCTSLKALQINDVKFVNDSGVELSNAEYNTLLNDTLKNITSLENISIINMYEITDITFVKNCTKLIQVDVRNTNISTHKKVNGISTEYEDGLKLLNIYVPLLRAISCNNSLDDFSLIQTAINKCNSTASISNNLAYNWGLVSTNAESAKTFSKCTNIEYFYSSDLRINVDLSNCKNLKSLYIYFWNDFNSGSWGKLYTDVTVTLPEILTENNPGYSAVIYYLHHNTKVIGGKGCTNLLIGYSRSMTNEDFWNAFSGFKNSSKLKELKVMMPEEWQDNISSANLDSVFGGCSNLESIFWQGRAQNIGQCKNINILSKLPNLKTITFKKTSIDTIPDLSRLTALTTLTIEESNLIGIDGIKECRSLEKIYFNTNSLYSLSAISSLENLNYLDVRNNKIAETAKVSTGTVNNITILNTLKDTYGKLTKNLLISGNLLVDKSGLSWATNK